MSTSVTTEPEDSVYDYIVCGGGTSGSVLAARLAEDPNISVLVIEAGQHNSLLEATRMPGGHPQLLETEPDWNIITEPNPGANGRRVKVGRGKFLGGSTGMNGTLCIRGTKQDYDDWNMPGWSGEDMWRYMKKAESFHGEEWFGSDENDHGYEGPIDIEPPGDFAPISDMILESMQSQGLPLHPDMFSTGEFAQGSGHAPRTVYKGERSTAANYYINKGPNLTIKTDTIVDKVILHGSESDLKAVAVQVIERNGTEKVIKAKKEIIVSGGAYCSPPILLRSGIGPKDELASYGIECQVDLPGVGKNLMDHPLVFIFYSIPQQILTKDHLLYKPNAINEAFRQWEEEKRGPLASFPFGAVAYARLDERLKDSEVWNTAPRLEGRDPMGLTPSQPNVEFLNIELYGGPKQCTDFPDGETTHVFGMLAELFSQRSRGEVKLASKDAKMNPIVDHNYLADELDVLVLSEACRFANEIIVNGKGTQGVIDGSWPKTLNHHTYTTREKWISFAKENVTTCYHPGGTCKMGADDDSMAVLDTELRVRSVKGLRVVDTSVMPTLNQGHTQMPAYAIGEKAADLIKRDC